MLLGSDILEVAIGVVFLFTLLAIVASAVTEAISQAFAMRSRTLHKALVEVMGCEAGRDAFYDHPLIKSLSRQGYIDKAVRRIARPSYIPASVFAAAFTNLTATTANPTALTFAWPAWAVGTPLPTLLATITEQIPATERNLARVRQEVESWFDQAMERVSGWYKRLTTVVIFAVATIVVVFANADTVRYAEALSVNPQVRAAVVAAADRLLPADAGGSLPDVDQAKAQLAKLDFAIGWVEGDDRGNPRTVPKLSWSLGELAAFAAGHVPGWLIMIFAISLGAPFWFDVLGRLAKLRSSGDKPA